jgi:succinoglycan biosynthesis transport protein ExoP
MESNADEMTLRDYLGVVRRRWWVVLVAVVLAAGISVALSAASTPIYEAEAQMLVASRTNDTVFSNGQQLNANDATRAVQTEIQVLEGEVVEQRVRTDLGVDGGLPDADGSVVGSTDVIAVRVRSEDPQTAQNLANAYVQAYIDNRREQAVESLIAAATQLQDQMTEIQGQIDALPDGDPQRDSLLAQQATFRQTLNQLQVDTALKTGGASVVKSADLPSDPIEPTPLRSAVLAGIVGLLIGLAAAFAVDYFDDSVRTEHDLDRITPQPVLAVVPIDPPVDNRPVAVSAPGDFAVETYRGLRTNVQFLALDRPLKVIQVTSSLPGEGKTTTATNLACVLAQAGRSVAIVDADLRRPRVHEVFATTASPGLIDLLVGESFSMVEHRLDVGGDTDLSVVAAGNVPANPSELLSSQRCRSLIQAIAERFDHVIVDSAPILPVADSIALSAGVDAVLFVAQSGRTSKRDISEALERLDRVGAPVIGIVLNRASRKNGAGAYGYGYGGGYGQAYGSGPAAPTKPADDVVDISTSVVG